MVFISPDLIGRLFIGGGSLWGGVPLSHASEVDGTNPGFGAIAFLGDVQGPFPWETNQAWCFFFFWGGFGSSYMFESLIHLIPEDGWLNIGDPFPSWGPFPTFQWSTRCRTSEV